MDSAGSVVNCYTYDPWGLAVGDETSETVSNLYRFAGYVWDSEISQYYCNARQYDPVLARFTSRDPVESGFKEPMTLHKYLYCENDPVNRSDPSGELWGAVRRTYRTIHGISAYYTGLYMGLQAARDPWDVMDVAIAANKWREAYLDPDNLTKTFGWEIALQQGFGNVLDKIQNACDWGDLTKCIGAESWGYIKGRTRGEIAALTLHLCCRYAPTPVVKMSCCAGAMVMSVIVAVPVGEVDLMVGVSDCFSTHCGK